MLIDPENNLKLVSIDTVLLCTYMDFHVDLDWDEAFEYRAGQTVELKSNPGTFRIIESYEVRMVPPIWLENDPCPRYPHELHVVTPSEVEVDSPRECLLPTQH